MPDWIAILLLGIIEGVTEFLPVSSTGHLLLAEKWLPAQSDLFNVVIQSGAVLAVLLVFWKRAGDLIRGWRQPATFQLLLKFGLAFFITGVGGLVLKKLDFELTEKAEPVAWATLIGGILILMVERWIKGRRLSEEVTWSIAIAVGLAQLAAAVFPGLSRSGSTILIALALGLSRPAAAEFSFLLGIPTLLSAGALKLFAAFQEGAAPEPWGLLLLGTISSAVTAFLVVRWLLHFVQTRTFDVFGWYRIVLGLAILTWL